MADLNRTDLEFILQQILMAEGNQPPVNEHLTYGLRTVSGENNSLVPGQETYGAADQPFPRVGQAIYLDGKPITLAADSIFNPTRLSANPTEFTIETPNYLNPAVSPFTRAPATNDADPRVISNLVSDQSIGNPAAIEAALKIAGLPATPTVINLLTAAWKDAIAAEGYVRAQLLVDHDAAVTARQALIAANPADADYAALATADAQATAAYEAHKTALATDTTAKPYFDFLTMMDTMGLAFEAPRDTVGEFVDGLAKTSLVIENQTPDAALSAPYNTWMTLFGQFFDHGLDLVPKSSTEKVIIWLQPSDPLYSTAPGAQNFMILSRATGTAGPDGIRGTADDTAGTNVITPFVDQSQTYTSHPSHQAFLREYTFDPNGTPHATGRLLNGSRPDGSSGMPTWGDLKENALNLGIKISDKMVGDIPLLATDDYGNLILSNTGRAQVVVHSPDGTTHLVSAGTHDNPLDLSVVPYVSTGHQFLNDIAFFADPNGVFIDSTGVHAIEADTDNEAGNAIVVDRMGNKLAYDDELLDSHFIAGDGRVNENFGLTAVHEVFHSEHNRQVEHIKATVNAALAAGDTSFVQNWVRLTPAQLTALAGQADAVVPANAWNGERLWQAAKFATETQYQHLVFEEFARKVAPSIHLFGNLDIHLDSAITAEFAHAVYRFGHSMLDESLPGLETADGNQTALLKAFLNPLAYAAQGEDAVAQIVNGTAHQVGNEIDEFVTGALRNNLLGLPLDLAALNIARGRDTGIPPLNLLRAELYSLTHDTSLKPYANWAEFGEYLKHEGSLVNFVASYGTHSSLLAIDRTATDALVQLRTAAVNLIKDGLDPTKIGSDAWNFMHSSGAYANNKAHDLAVHVTDPTTGTSTAAQWSTGSITGLDRVDLWIGGLAEKQNLFGGLLGSTFNFIFETQMENLQDGDRFYYLPRIEGLHWGSEIEANSFAEMIMRNNPGVKGLSASVFLTPEYVVDVAEVNALDAANGHNVSDYLRNEDGKALVETFEDPNDPAGPRWVHFIGSDNFFGNTIVMDGTEQDDRILAGQADDDTIWAKGGDDTIDGNNGNDFLFGGDGNDLITDSAGDDNMHGDEGNDEIHGGIGDDLLFGGNGDDYLDGGAGIDGIVGGEGNDLIIGGEDDDEVEGNEGDDWIEGGLGGDLLVGDQGAPTGQVPLISGNDVLDGGAGGDKMLGFTGDDIMFGLGGFDKFLGKYGYDWAVYEQETHGVDVDMERKDFIPGTPGGDAVRDNFIETEGVSGSRFDDFLSGTIDSRLDPLNELSNVNLIDGLLAKQDPATGEFTDLEHAFFMPSADGVHYSGGNLMLGGDGSDTIFGRGGNDIIDGDAHLTVSRTWDTVNGLQIDRRIEWGGQAGDIDVVSYTGARSDYRVEVADGDAGLMGFYKVTSQTAAGVINDGAFDLIRNIERIQFSDGLFTLRSVVQGANTLPTPNSIPTGAVTISDATPAVGQLLTANANNLNDLDGIPRDANNRPIVDFQWQYQDAARGQWVNIPYGPINGQFTPTAFYEGKPLRVLAQFTDLAGARETVVSAITAPVGTPGGVNTAPIIIQQQQLVGVPDTATDAGAVFNQTIPLYQIFSDAQDITANLTFTLTWNGIELTPFPGAPVEGELYFDVLQDANGNTVGQLLGIIPADAAGQIDLVMTVTDTGGLAVTDAFAIVINPAIPAAAGTADSFNATEDTPLTVAAAGGVLANDVPASGTTAALVSGTTHGTIHLNADGSFSYVPNANFSGQDQFTYVAQTTTGTSAVTTATIDVTAVNDGEAPVNVTANARPNQRLTASLGTDPDGNGTGPVTWAWKVDGTLVTGATTTRFDIPAGTTVGTVITAEATYTDLQGFTRTAVSSNVVVGTTFAVATGASAADRNVTGSSGNDLMTGNGAADTLSGGAGDDSIDGLDGADQLNGGLGNDTLLGGNGADVIHGNEGNDSIDGQAGADNLFGDDGHDTIIGSVGADVIDGGNGNDRIEGSGGNDLISGGAGDDTIVWTPGNDRDIVDGGANDIGGDTFVMNRNTQTEHFFVFTKDAFLAATGLPAASLANGTEIVAVRTTVANPTATQLAAGVAAELRGIEEIRLGAGNTTVGPITGPLGNDTFAIVGDFTNTNLRLNTITIEGSEEGDTIDISSLQSAHRIVFKPKGGTDVILGTLRPQDVIEMPSGSQPAVVTVNADGTTTVSDGTSSVTFDSDGTPEVHDGSGRLVDTTPTPTDVTNGGKPTTGTGGEVGSGGNGAGDGTAGDGVHNGGLNGGQHTGNEGETQTGGNTSGGNTSGGNTSGGNTSGGGADDTGGSTGGGSNGGDDATTGSGGSSGGNTSGGSTSGGNTSGGNTSGSGADDTGGSTGGGSNGGDDATTGSGGSSGGNTSGGSTSGGNTSGGNTSGGGSGNNDSTGGSTGGNNGGTTGGTGGSTIPGTTTPLPMAALVATADHDALTGTGGEDHVQALSGDDAVVTHGGSDVVAGGEGNDIVNGGADDDILAGGNGDDILLGSTGLDTIFGDAGADRLFGGDGADLLSGGLGNDSVFGGAGDDLVTAELNDGNDVYWGDAGVDTYDASVSTANLTIDVGTGFGGKGSVSGLDIGSDTIWGFENVVAGSGNDTITASNAVNVLDGGAGNDVFRFVSASAADGDTILGFEPGDRIDLSAIDANTGTATNDAFTIVSGGAFSAAGQLLVTFEQTAQGDFTVVQGNIDADLGADFTLRIAGHHDLGNGSASL
ncbi:peroxidase family protein [Alsobacter sp. R-9]